jgi:hypothetical protein
MAVMVQTEALAAVELAALTCAARITLVTARGILTSLPSPAP